VTSAVVIPVRDATGSADPLLADKATDALALALEDSKSYRVIPKEDLTRELKTMDLTPPLDENQQSRVGKDLQADLVFTATLTSCSVSDSGAVRTGVDLRSYNVKIGAVLNGAAVEVTTKTIPGWNKDPLPEINEALRQVAEQAVGTLESHQVRHGNIDLVDDQGIITTNLGINDGITLGTRCQVDRGRWDASRQEEVLDPIGVVEMIGVQVRLSQAKVMSGMMPSIGDRVYVLYTPPSIAKTIQQGHATTQNLRYLAGLALVVGIVATATGENNSSPPGINAYLYQTAPGTTPFVHVGLNHSAVPGSYGTLGWLIYRGENLPPTPNPLIEGTTPADGGPLIAVINIGSTSAYNDHTPSPLTELDDLTANVTGTYNDAGTSATITLTATYNNAALVVGNTYYYVAQRLIEPIAPEIPGQTGTGTGATAAAFSTITFTVTPQNALGQASQPAGPITYLLPATTISPNLTSTVNPASTTFQWSVTAATGTTQFQVQVYTDASLGTLVATSPLLTYPAGQTTMQYPRPGHSSDAYLTLPGSSPLVWVVACRTQGQANPSCSVLGAQTLPFLLSTAQPFNTVASPPGGPGASSVKSGRPSAVQGFWNAVHQRRAGR
jgi:hypothetical protein